MSHTPSPSSTPNNPELLIWSLFLLGGSDNYVDVEELFIKSFELAPARLSWRTRQDIPDYKKCSKALQEVEDRKRSQLFHLFEKQGAYKRKLSSAGVEWVTQYSNVLATLYSGGIVPSAAVQEDSKALRRITDSDLFQNFLRSEFDDLNVYEISDLFRCLPDADQAIWKQRLDRVRNAAIRNGNTRVVAFVDKCADIVWAKGEEE
jgi:hypothetical protein